jgi:hypothetical protein
MRLFLIALCVITATGCAFSCTLMFAPDTLTVEADSGALDEGLWRIEVDGIGCEILLPSLPDDEPVCDQQARLEWTEERIVALTIQQHSPDEVVLVVSRDGSEVHVGPEYPDWRESEPNGKGCGTRRVARLKVAL